MRDKRYIAAVGAALIAVLVLGGVAVAGGLTKRAEATHTSNWGLASAEQWWGSQATSQTAAAPGAPIPSGLDPSAMAPPAGAAGAQAQRPHDPSAPIPDRSMQMAQGSGARSGS